MLNNKIKRGHKSQETIFHSDQGTIYSSVAFNNAHKDYNTTRLKSKVKKKRKTYTQREK